MDIKQQWAFRTPGGREQSGHQAEQVFQDQDIRGMRTNGTSRSRGHLGIKQKWTRGTLGGRGQLARTSSSKGHLGCHAAKVIQDISWQRTNGTFRSR